MKVNTDQMIQIAKIAGGIILVSMVAKAVGSFTGKNEKPNKSQTDIDKVKEAQQASLLLNAIGSWYEDTDEDAIMRIAAEISDYKKVADYYYDISGGFNLTSDLQKGLSSSDYAKFISIMSANSKKRIAAAISPTQEIFKYKAGSAAVAKSEKSPILSFSDSSSIVGYTKTRNINLGPIMKRVNTPEGNFYMVNIRGENRFVREEHLV